MKIEGMNVQEFKAWLCGFKANMVGPPNETQWTEICERVAGMDAAMVLCYDPSTRTYVSFDRKYPNDFLSEPESQNGTKDWMTNVEPDAFSDTSSSADGSKPDVA